MGRPWGQTLHSRPLQRWLAASAPVSLDASLAQVTGTRGPVLAPGVPERGCQDSGPWGGEGCSARQGRSPGLLWELAGPCCGVEGPFPNLALFSANPCPASVPFPGSLWWVWVSMRAATMSPPELPLWRGSAAQLAAQDLGLGLLLHLAGEPRDNVFTTTA